MRKEGFHVDLKFCKTGESMEQVRAMQSLTIAIEDGILFDITH